jgi:hypothetical protein
VAEVDAGVDERFDEFCVRLGHERQNPDLRIADCKLKRPVAVQRAIRNPRLRNSFRAARAEAAAKSRFAVGLGLTTAVGGAEVALAPRREV